MQYKAFEDWYHEADIKHLVLQEYKGSLVSPPFATEKCKDYSTFVFFDGKNIKLNLPNATSKTNACETINGDIWCVPYGIYDEFDVVVQIKDNQPIYHKLNFKGKGQFYSLATDGTTGFSFPLGYAGTNVGIYINDGVKTIPLPVQGKKLHMGTVYCNGRYWSMPRSDDPGYNLLLSFDGERIESYPITGIDNSITRKYSDIIVVGKTLYALPFGETAGLNEIVEFDTTSNTLSIHPINGHDFAKKYNNGVYLNGKIVGLPYGEDYNDDSNWGIVFDTETKTSRQFDIGLKFGGKYRYRSGIAFNNHAYFFPAGTPSCPIIKLDSNGNILRQVYMKDWLVGRPVIHNNLLKCISYNIFSKRHILCSFDENLNLFSQINIT